MEKIIEFWEDHRQICIGVGIAVIIGGWWLINSLSANSQVTGKQLNAMSTSVASSKPVSKSAKVTGEIYVDVKGAVKHPGVFKLPAKSRVQEALKVAGGPENDADLKQVNLAKQLTDAQVVEIPKIGEKLSANVGGQVNPDSQGGGGHDIINLNQASKEDLHKITGVGDKKADLIIAYRQEHGGFKKIDDIKNITGFGEKTFAKIKDQLAV